MARCLDAETIERLVAGALPSRATAAARRHAAGCAACKDAVAEAHANQAFLRDVQAAGEMAEVRAWISARVDVQTIVTRFASASVAAPQEP